jgi:uncharacterized protein (DUF2249 family)
LRKLESQLEAEADKSQDNIPASAVVTVPKMIEKLNEPKGHALLIIQAHNPDELRNFASTLGSFAYEERRRTGQITPLVSFLAR